MKQLVSAVSQKAPLVLQLAGPAPLAGASLGNQNPETLLYSMRRFFRFLPREHQRGFLDNRRENAS
jgi:hypothetical protein